MSKVVLNSSAIMIIESYKKGFHTIALLLSTVGDSYKINELLFKKLKKTKRKLISQNRVCGKMYHFLGPKV